MRRSDLLVAGYSDARIRSALASGEIFRVRHGWYALRGTHDAVTRVVRIGGRLTGLAALRTLDVFLPTPRLIDVVVPRGAAGLRDPGNRRKRLPRASGVRVRWLDEPRYARSPSDWITSEDDSLLCVLIHETREVAVSCCDALVRHRGWEGDRLDAVFARAPARVQSWRTDVDGRADAWGETAARLRITDAGLPFEPQVYVPNVGRIDGRVSPRAYVEIDGRQHGADWVGDAPSSFEDDHERDIQLLLQEGAHTVRITYRQLEHMWDSCLAAIRRAYLDDVGPGGPSAGSGPA